LGVLHSVALWLGLVRGMAGQALGLPSPWEHSIRAFEARDRRRAPSQGAVVFVGSSCFTLWSSLEEDMAPLPAVNRGFGGALIDDVVRYADRIVVPYQPSAGSSWAVTVRLTPSSTAAMASTRARAAIASGREKSPLRFITNLL
jgi:hypothetical protein